jgi:1,4-dihydroxy-2-naphthoate octaprenyltransferase
MLKRFLSFVEIRTKLASIMPFLLGLAYAGYAFRRISLLNSLLFFGSMLLFDMATTALNNYMDAKTNGAPLQFTKPAARLILLALLLLATAGGLLLTWQAGLVVLAVGAACFLVGIMYTAGPAPIAHMPLGEIFSGLFMGFCIPFLTVYVNAPRESLIDYSFSSLILGLTFNLGNLLRLAVLSIPPICGIANIMLANNICDLDYDVSIKRYTLPYYIGRQRALWLFAALYGIALAAVIAAAMLGILPPYVLAAAPFYILIWLNVRQFWQKQDKKQTFPLSVQNFLLMMAPMILVVSLAALID